jgi:hypothetical protein
VIHSVVRVTIPWDDRLPTNPPVAGDVARPGVSAPWIGADPPTPPPVSRVPVHRARGGQVWMVMAGVVVALALLTAVYLVTSAT